MLPLLSSQKVAFSLLFPRLIGTHAYTYLPLPSVWRCHLFSFISPSSLPFFRVTTSLLPACLYTSPLLKSLSLVLSQHICCSSPGSSWTPLLFLSGSLLVGRSLLTDDTVNVPFVCPYLLTSFIYMSVVNTCCTLPFRHQTSNTFPPQFKST